MLLQEPYPPTEPLLFSVYKKFGIPAINSGLEIGSENRVRRMLEAAGFMDIQV